MEDFKKTTQKQNKKQARFVEDEDEDQEMKTFNTRVNKPSAINEIISKQKERPEFHIRAGYNGQYFQGDLLDVSTYSWANSGIHFLANFIDVYSRYAWVFPLKSKDELRPKFREMLSEMRETNPKNVQAVLEKRIKSGQQNPKSDEKDTPYPEHIIYDGESTAKAGEVIPYARSLGIDWVTIPPGDKMPVHMIERFNYEVRRMIAKEQFQTKNDRYLDALPNLVKRYNNNTTNSTTGKTPKQIYIKDETFKETRKDLEPRFKIGDFVRLRKQLGKFDKASRTAKFSYEIYQIVGNESAYRFTVQRVGASKAEAQSHKPEQMKLVKYDPVTDKVDEVAEQKEEKQLEDREEVKQNKKQLKFLNAGGIDAFNYKESRLRPRRENFIDENKNNLAEIKTNETAKKKKKK